MHAPASSALMVELAPRDPDQRGYEDWAINHVSVAPNGSRLSCGALKKDSFPNLRAPTASSAC